jgi:acyl-CoA synthetase (AMP-forming)/AMP-acid ligase II
VTRTLVDLLRMRAASHADRGFAFLVGDAVTERLTYADLDREARRIAAGLAARGIARGTPALLAFPPGLDFISAFWGCIYAGVIAVPVPPPHPARLARTLPRLRAIAANADASAVLTTAALAPSLDLALPLVDIATLAGDLDAGAPGDLALLQYTSGSTRDPRGVMITHANLLHNLSLLRTFHADQEHMVMVHWLPLYHDMGLIRGMLSPLDETPRDDDRCAELRLRARRPQGHRHRCLRPLRAEDRILFGGADPRGDARAIRCAVRTMRPRPLRIAPRVRPRRGNGRGLR